MPHGSRSGTDSNLAGLGVRWGLSREGTAALLGLLAGGSRPPPPLDRGGHPGLQRYQPAHQPWPNQQGTSPGRQYTRWPPSAGHVRELPERSRVRKTTQSKRKAPTIILPVYYRAVKLMDTASRTKSHSHGSAGSRTRLDSTHHTRRHDRVKWGGSQVHGPENLGDPLMLNALLQHIGGTV
ncbi:Hypothetical predicted protein [Pelobates cultripes]|uniref:Uncharacterized protein n=1 Tax=Pelobates cultripes TaxID=61616 RepID=A0AAD1R1S7_PELCU|nr:Hypothetical predicted protein [Pelobates cultripes]